MIKDFFAGAFRKNLKFAKDSLNNDYLIPVYGQSYAIGASDGKDQPYNIIPLNPERLLMPDDPGFLYPSRRKFSNYAPLREQRHDALYNASISETICSECGNRILQGLAKRRDETTRVIMGVVGRGNRPIESFIVSGPYFTHLRHLITQCHRISARQGRRLIVPAVVFLQGQKESQTGVRHWTRLRQILTLQDAIEDMTRNITHQVRSVAMFHMDPGNTAPADSTGWSIPDIAMACEQASRMSPERHINVGAMYAHQHTSSKALGGTHPTVTGYRTLGVQIGQAIDKHLSGVTYVATSVQSWSMLDQASILVRLRTSPQVGALADWSNSVVKWQAPHALGGGGGWAARDATSLLGGPPLVVERLTQGLDFHPNLSTDSVVLTLNREAKGHLELTYATTLTKKRNHYGRGRGVIRSAGNPIRPKDTNPIYNWLHPTMLS